MKTATTISLSAAIVAAVLQVGAIGVILGDGPARAVNDSAKTSSAVQSGLTRQANAATSQAEFDIEGK